MLGGVVLLGEVVLLGDDVVPEVLLGELVVPELLLGELEPLGELELPDEEDGPPWRICCSWIMASSFFFCVSSRMPRALVIVASRNVRIFWILSSRDMDWSLTIVIAC